MYMPPEFRDFPLCVACYAARERARAARPSLRSPSYRSPLHALEKAHGHHVQY